MQFDFESRYDFLCPRLPPDTFGVVEFHGREEVSAPYRFEVTLVSDNPFLDTDLILNASAMLVIRQGVLFSDNDVFRSHFPSGFGPDLDRGDVPIHGVVIEFEQMHEAHGMIFYRAVLVPRLWMMSIDRQHQVYLDRSIPEIIEMELQQAHLRPHIDYEILLERWKGGPADSVDEHGYPRWEYLCQYNESSLEFVHRLMEREGIYYYFEQNEKCERMIITNSLAHHGEIYPRTVPYAADSGLEAGPAIRSFVCREQRLPQRVAMRDYNYERPNLLLQGRADVAARGQGEVYYYGDHFRTPEEGDYLARIRAEEIRVWQRTFRGESNAGYIRPGHRCGILGHYRQPPEGAPPEFMKDNAEIAMRGLELAADFYTRFGIETPPGSERPGFYFPFDYFVVRIDHEGSQSGFIISGMGTKEAERERRAHYKNTFVALASDVQFRPARRTPKPQIHGTLSAMIDLDALDDTGRYKVRMPFDRGDRQEGKACCWCRFAKPYTGESFGMHFPLRRGTEVLVAFVDGDPDRPIIVGAMENPNTPSQTNDVNLGVLRFATGGTRRFSTLFNGLNPATAGAFFGSGFTGYTGEANVAEPTWSADRAVDRPASASGETTAAGGGGLPEDLLSPVFDTEGNPDFVGFAGTVVSRPTFTDPQVNQTSTHGPRFSESVLPYDVDDDTSSANTANLGSANVHHKKHLGIYKQDAVTEYRAGRYLEGYGPVRQYDITPNGIYVIESANGTLNEKMDFPKLQSGQSKGSAQPVSGGGNFDDVNGTDGVFLKQIFGDTYSFHDGDEYIWDNTCVYDFGNGYTENHVTIDGLAGSGSQTWNSWAFSVTESEWSDNSLIEKTWVGSKADKAGVLEYRKGYAQEYIDGESESYVTGRVYENVNGNTCEITSDGNITEIFNGDWKRDEVYGTDNHKVHGSEFGLFMGGLAEMSLAGAFAMELSAKLEITGGLHAEIFLGLKFEYGLAVAMEIFNGMKCSMTYAIELELRSGVYCENNVAIEAKFTGGLSFEYEPVALKSMFEVKA